MTQLLNSSFEVGVRVVAMLTALYPTQADLARIVLLDHVVLHSEDFEGGTSLHPATPGRVGELGVKRELVREGIHLMGARGLLVRNATLDGIYYVASDDARPFLDSMDAPYLARLRERCSWAASEFGLLSDDAIRTRLSEVFGRWAEEFEYLDRQELND
ncbi:ABC-three component system middle component 2 [Rhodococcus sp. NPDC060090]|uniref:ABC-three component system middle component 2 n=1 Tax=Rhodococcus sp. NPDC060090 TaxID=3347056 RepID=UPI0036681B23